MAAILSFLKLDYGPKICPKNGFVDGKLGGALWTPRQVIIKYELKSELTLLCMGYRIYVWHGVGSKVHLLIYRLKKPFLGHILELLGISPII